MITDWLMAFFTLIIVALTFLIWKVYERIAWLTGAMESHSDMLLRIEALRGIDGKQIELVWWDPSIEDVPTLKEHGKPIELKRIYIYLPPKFRRNKPTFGAKLRNLFRLSET
jgi:hypothetical protein